MSEKQQSVPAGRGLGAAIRDWVNEKEDANHVGLARLLIGGNGTDIWFGFYIWLVILQTSRALVRCRFNWNEPLPEAFAPACVFARGLLDLSIIHWDNVPSQILASSAWTIVFCAVVAVSLRELCQFCYNSGLVSRRGYRVGQLIFCVLAVVGMIALFFMCMAHLFAMAK
jgi:hypothetical protein